MPVGHASIHWLLPSHAPNQLELWVCNPHKTLAAAGDQWKALSNWTGLQLHQPCGHHELCTAIRRCATCTLAYFCADVISSVCCEVFGCRKTTPGVRSGLSGATRMTFCCILLTEDWIEKHAELQVALALAVGEQQFEPWMQRNAKQEGYH